MVDYSRAGSPVPGVALCWSVVSQVTRAGVPRETTRVNTSDFFARSTLLNLPQLRRDRPDWTDRLPVMYERPTLAQTGLVKRHWSHMVPTPVRECYDIWRVRRRHARNLEQIEIDQLNEVVEQAMLDDCSERIEPIYDKHEKRRIASGFIVAAKERPRIERLARRWDVDWEPLVNEGEADEVAIRRMRRAVREARWTFLERCAKTLIPVLSLLVALTALLLK
jgi:hypothetical protein